MITLMQVVSLSLFSLEREDKRLVLPVLFFTELGLSLFKALPPGLMCLAGVAALLERIAAL